MDARSKPPGQQPAVSASSIHADPPPPIVSEPDGINYVTGKALGKGGFAICHKAERYNGSKPTGQIVALKIVKAKMEPQKLAQKFGTELQIHSKLSHPNIVAFYRAFSFSTSTYVVLELCSNGSLADMLKRRKHLTLPEIRRLVIQVCGAVKYLHHRHIVHRDLKTGNLFLDEQMNVKVGDFGLAALLVTGRDLEHTRRTTMCGTPNYLAPEILEKGKGHDEKVDLWAIGVIAYTLAVGKAPFHANTKEEIYKKLKCGTYTWPELSATTNQSTDLRDLVSSLLVPEELRPSPDQIVSHPFFKIAYVPSSIPEAAKEKVPTWSEACVPTPDIVRRGYSDTWFRTCKESGVGEYAEGKCFMLNNGRKVRSVVHDIQREIQAGLQPTIPLAQDIVYVSTINDLDQVPDVNVAHSQVSSISGRSLKELSHNEVATQRPPTVRRERATTDAELMPPPPSRAASRLGRAATVRKAARTISEEAANSSESGRVRSDSSSGAAEAIHVTRTRAPATLNGIVTALRETNTAPSSIYQTAISQQSIDEKPKRTESVKRSADASLARRPRATHTTKERPLSAIESYRRRPADSSDESTRPRSPPARPRPAATLDELKEAYPFQYRRKHQATIEVVDILSDHDSDDHKRRYRPTITKPRSNTTASSATTSTSNHKSTTSLTSSSLILLNTDPAAVLRNLTTFHTTLTAALANKPNLSTKSSPLPTPEDPTTLPFVSRWVDYSRKHGVGYVLADGTIGCIINAASIPFTNSDGSNGATVRARQRYDAPVAHAFVRNGGTWLKKLGWGKEYDMEGVPLEVYENMGEGDDAVGAAARAMNEAGIQKKVYKGVGSVREGVLAAEEERRRVLGVLWVKFGRYMWKTVGEEQAGDLKEGGRKEEDGSVKFVRFFQRLANVGFWAFVDGSLQVHFPDHTKLVISPTGQTISATLLNVEGAAHLVEHGDLLATHVSGRVVITSSDLRGLLHDTTSRTRAKVVKANRLSEKLEFVSEVVSQWIRNGGLGRLDKDELLEWEGIVVKDTTKKLDRVTVGRYGGDDNGP